MVLGCFVYGIFVGRTLRSHCLAPALPMDVKDFYHKHEGEEIIVVCNGPGLKNIPLAFLESRTNFAINFLPHWLQFIRFDYWVALDQQCYEMVSREVLTGVPKFIKRDHEKFAESSGFMLDGLVVPFGLDDKIEGLGYGGDPSYARYSTSAIAASHLAVKMGASKVLLVGFDCTHDMHAVKRSEGRTGLPHIYDKETADNPGKTHNSWSMQFGHFAEWAKTQGSMVINLSIPTTCGSLLLGDYRDFWQPPEQLQPVRS